MKLVRTALNEEEYKRFMRHAHKLGMSEYGLAKKLVTDFLKSKDFWEHKQPMGICFFYLFICYTLIVTTVVLIFL